MELTAFEKKNYILADKKDFMRFTEVDFSELEQIKATHNLRPRKINLDGETCKVS